MLGDVRVCSGDLIVGDADGVVVVPRQRMQEVLTRALQTREVEEQILQAALGGLPLNEARKKIQVPHPSARCDLAVERASQIN